MATGIADQSQTVRPMTVTTDQVKPQDGQDVLLLVGFRGHEGISECFNFQLDIVVKNKNKGLVVFEKLLGQPMTINLLRAGGTTRFFSGICISIGQGEEDNDYIAYGVEIAPRFELLNKRTQCRIFQHETVPEILREVLTGGGLEEGVHWDFKMDPEAPHFQPRNYCVQYRESDFNFASRLMEEEGIYYYFTHSASDHKMVLCNKTNGHPPIEDPVRVTYLNAEGGVQPEDRVHDWSKIQQLTACRYTLWDSNFELPGHDLGGVAKALDTVQAGHVTHKLRLGINDDFEVYDYPGEYAQRFDSVPKEGSGKQDDVAKAIFGGGYDPGDAARTAEIRMQQETSQALFIRGASYCRHFMSGHKFELNDPQRQDKSGGNGKADSTGEYLLTSVQHAAKGGGIRSGEDAFCYHNMFTCTPVNLPYRPLRRTMKPVVYGSQTAVVVGPKEMEIFTDKYGRVKVQFPWFRPEAKDQKKYADDTSCWVRVAQAWAGAHWGTSFWPRIGQEVIVAFLEGDPDRPIIIGSVYNDSQLPPYLGEPPDTPSPDKKHPRDPKVSGIKTNTTPGGVGFNELRFDDTKGKEQVFIHSQRNMDVRVRASSMERVGGSRHLIVGGKDKDGNLFGDQIEEVYRNKDLHVRGSQNELIDETIALHVGGGKGEDSGSRYVLIDKSSYEFIGEDLHHQVSGTRRERVGNGYLVEVGEFHLKAGTTVVIDAGADLTIKGKGGFVKIDAEGVTIQGKMVNINCGGEPGTVKAAQPKSPFTTGPQTPAEAYNAQTGFKSAH